MTTRPLQFSIIIPTYNRADMLAAALESIVGQRISDVEIIVVDDGSTDNTEAVVSSFGDRRVTYMRIRNSERGAARNAGLKVAKGTYVNFFDSDDLFNPSLESIQKFLTDNNYPPVVFGSIQLISNEGVFLKAPERPFTSFSKCLLHNNFLACGSVFVRKDVAEKFPFSEDRRLSGAEDWELWLRIYSQHDFLDSRIAIFRQRQHTFRSLNQANSEKEIERELAFIEHIFKARSLLDNRFSAGEMNLLIADRYSFIALSMTTAGNRKTAADALRKAMRTSLRVLGRKRFWAVLKKIIFK
jgi:glycosyltransferase involved in cell wall biosynthesis